METQARFRGNASKFPRRSDFRDGPRISDRPGTDHCFDGWPGHATIRYEAPARSVLLDGCEATRFLIVYIPAGADYFCLEPVTHAVNAMNLPDAAQGGLWTLEPRATREISMTIRCQHEGDAPPFEGDAPLSIKVCVPFICPLYLTRLAAATSLRTSGPSP